jgi:hypothetical protein
MARELKEEEKGALDLAALKVPTSKGVYWDRRRSRWRVQLKKYGKQWHEGLGAGIDDHTKAVALHKRHESKTKNELEALFIRQ